MRLTTILLVLLGVAAAPLAAQRTLTRAVDLHAVPGDRPVARLHEGIPVRTGQTRSGYTEVTIEGWVSATYVAGRRERFPISIRVSAEEVRLRSGPGTSNRIIAVTRGGMGLTEISRRRNWVHVRRTGWVPSSALSRVVAERERSVSAGTVAVDNAPAEQAPPARTTSSASAPPQQVLTPTATIALRRAPEQDATATLEPGARVVPLARERGWVRVQVEGWVRESELVPADTSVRASLSAADLRANPDGTRGQLVRWTVEVLSLQRADVLRKGLELDEPYLLARGPGEEDAILYLAVPESLLETARTLPALAEVSIVARVRSGRSDPAGVPILELQSIAQVP